MTDKLGNLLINFPSPSFQLIDTTHYSKMGKRKRRTQKNWWCGKTDFEAQKQPAGLVTWQFGRIAMEGRVENLSRVRATHTGRGGGRAICPEQRWYGDINIRFVELCSCLFGVSGKSASYV